MATQVTITGMLQDIGGNDLINPTNNCWVRFILRGFQGFFPQIAGMIVLAEPNVDALPGAGGTISQLLWPNNAITPATTFYEVEFWSKGRVTSRGNYIFNTNTNLNTAVPIP